MEIVSTFTVLTDKNFDCKRCKVKYLSDPKKQEDFFIQRACKSPSKNVALKYTPLHEMHGSAKINYYTCPANVSDNGTAHLIGLYDNYDKGLSPYGGGFMDTPSKFVEVMNLVHNLKGEYTTQREKNLKKYKR